MECSSLPPTGFRPKYVQSVEVYFPTLLATLVRIPPPLQTVTVGDDAEHRRTESTKKRSPIPAPSAHIQAFRKISPLTSILYSSTPPFPDIPHVIL